MGCPETAKGNAPAAQTRRRGSSLRRTRGRMLKGLFNPKFMTWDRGKGIKLGWYNRNQQVWGVEGTRESRGEHHCLPEQANSAQN